VHAVDGEIREAARTLTHIREDYGGEAPCFEAAFLQDLTRGAIETAGVVDCGDAREANVLLRGLWATMSDDTTTALECVQLLDESMDPEDMQAEARLLRGWIAASQNEWERVIQLRDQLGC